MNITLQTVTKDNVDEAIDIGIRIFGEEDREGIMEEFRAAAGLQPEKDTIEADLHMVDPHYYIFCKDGTPTGVVGNYKIKGHEEDSWLGWFGILPEFRGGGVSRTIISETFNAAAREPGVKTIRFYTTREEKHKIAYDLYKKMGFFEEEYRPGATDAASMIVVFSRSAKTDAIELDFPWKDNAYPIDCDKYVIPEMNKLLGFDKGGPELQP